MQKGSHIGKVVVTLPDDPDNLPALGGRDELSFKPNASYLLVGGLGALGRAVSTWMAERGAKNLVYLSRSAGKTADDQAFIAELETLGCAAQTFPGDASVLGDVKRAVEGANFPIAGILQMTMVLRVWKHKDQTTTSRVEQR